MQHLNLRRHYTITHTAEDKNVIADERRGVACSVWRWRRAAGSAEQGAAPGLVVWPANAWLLPPATLRVLQCFQLSLPSLPSLDLDLRRLDIHAPAYPTGFLC